MKLSIIILNYNVRYFLELCLKSVQEAISDIDAEIIVIDNNSEDASCTMVKTLFPDVTLIENKTNFGFSKGNNIGVKIAKGEYLCILNPDTVVAEDTFTKLLQFADNKANLGIVGCRLIDGVGAFLPESKRNIPFVKAALLKLIGNSKDYYANHLKADETGKVDILVGAFMLMKREIYLQMDGFDEDYFMYGEDIDLSYKVLKAGYDNFYFSDTTVIHYKGESTLRDKNYARRFYGAMQIFYKKHFKKNVIFDLLVWFGVKMVYVLRIKPVADQKNVAKYIFVSDQRNKNLEAVLTKEVVLDLELNQVKLNDEIILDAEHLGYKKIILIVEALRKAHSVTFKILPKQSKFILGSDNSITRGEIIEWK
ncbi:MAG: glycosyltransferase family 2 protein [Algibacter sp.]